MGAPPAPGPRNERMPTARFLTRATAVAATLLLAAPLTACSGSGHKRITASNRTATGADPTTTPTTTAAPADVYAHTGAGDLNPEVASIKPRVWVPNSEANTVDVIDPATLTVVDHFGVGKLPQHVTPSWDLKTLYVDNDIGDTLTPIDAATGTRGTDIPVTDPYNLYFTPDGSRAIVVAERFKRLDIRDPHTWTLIKSIPIPYAGVDHLDFSADGKFLLASCEFSGYVVKVDLETLELVSVLDVGGQPVDVKLSPDGKVFYVANQLRDGVSIIDPDALKEIGFIPTGKGTHGLYPSRDAKLLYASNRGAGSVSVIDFATNQVVDTWQIGGSPDMGGVSTDGKQLWLTGRYDRAVYVIDTGTGKLIKTITVGRGAHGLCLFPQPGRFSLGHTGVYR